MKALLLLLAAALLAGCSSKTVTVGEPGQKGIVRRDIDTSKDVAKGMSDKIRQGEKDVNGG